MAIHGLHELWKCRSIFKQLCISCLEQKQYILRSFPAIVDEQKFREIWLKKTKQKKQITCCVIFCSCVGLFVKKFSSLSTVTSLFHFSSFTALVQPDPPFPPEMSPTSPLLSPQNSSSQSPLLQQAPPPGYQSPDMKSWQQTGMSSNRWGSLYSL